MKESNEISPGKEGDLAGRGIRHWGSLFLPLGVITQPEWGRVVEEKEELLHSFVLC